VLSSAGTAASTKVGLRAGRLSELVVWATPLVPIVLGLRLVWYTLPERPGQCTLRAIESAPSQSWPIWPLAGHIRSWRCGICTFEKLPLNRPLRAESPRVPPKEKSGRVPSEIGPQPGSQARLFASNGRRRNARAHVHRSFRLVRLRVGGTRDVRLDPSRGWHRQVITVARQWATPTEACQRPLSSLQALGS
jgi:hypothetical protein